MTSRNTHPKTTKSALAKRWGVPPPPLNLLHSSVFLEDRGTGETEELGVWKECLDQLVVLTELRTMALVEDEHHPLVSKMLKPLLEC